MSDITTEKIDEMPISDWLPIVPLYNAVLFPGATAPVAVSSDDAQRAVETAAKGNRIFLAVAIKEEPNDEKAPIQREQLYQVGTAALILRMMRGPDKSTQLVVRGLHKVQIVNFKYKGKLKVPFGKVKVLEEKSLESPKIEALMRQVAEKAEDLIQRSSNIPDELQGLPSSIQNPHRLTYMVLSLARLDMHRMQEIYETKSLYRKLRSTLKTLGHELEIADLGGKIQSEIQSKLSQTEKEYYLREQLDAIRKELGEGDDDHAEIEELRSKIERVAMSDEVRDKTEKELKRLARLSPNSPEYPMARNYLDWLIEYPWLIQSPDKLNIRRAQAILNKDHYNLKKAKDRILEFLAVRQLNPDIKGPILCFAGPPGVGKTSLGQSIARAMGRKFVRLSLGGVHDEAEIRGHRRTYIGALPGTIIQHIKRAGTNNPVFMLDEIDKVGRDMRGDPSSALLEVLDPEQNHSFRDNYMELDIDLSKVLFIATANVPDRIQPALRDRMEEIRLAGYTTRDKEEIANRYLIPRAVQNNGLSEKTISFGVGAIDYLIQGYTRESGVRNLERQIQSLCRKVAVKKMKGTWKSRKITSTVIQTMLGKQIFQDEVKRRTSIPGVATGLAWTSVGGEILFVEALPIPGGKGVTLTGKLGDVMKESAKAAYSVVRSRRKELGIDENFFAEHEIHLHVPAGAVPKDGPSAGVTMVTALASAAMNVPVLNEVAMTGEITLTGMVLPIGGLKEKVIAAHRAGIKTILIPRINDKDLDDIDKNIRRDLDIILIDKVDDVLKAALKTNKK